MMTVSCMDGSTMASSVGSDLARWSGDDDITGIGSGDSSGTGMRSRDNCTMAVGSSKDGTVTVGSSEDSTMVSMTGIHCTVVGRSYQDSSVVTVSWRLELLRHSETARYEVITIIISTDLHQWLACKINHYMSN